MIYVDLTFIVDQAMPPSLEGMNTAAIFMVTRRVIP